MQACREDLEEGCLRIRGGQEGRRFPTLQNRAPRAPCILPPLRWGSRPAQHSGSPRLHSRVAGHWEASPPGQPRPASPCPAPPSLPLRGRSEGRRGGSQLAWQALRLGSASLPGRRGRRRGGGGGGVRPPPPSAAGLFPRRPTLRAAPTPQLPRAASAAPAGA